VNRIRKIGNWIWLNKERMVLAVMVGFLIFRVYQVVYPDTPVAGDELVPYPSKELGDDVDRPGVPPALPPPPRMDDWSRLWRLNPMNYRQPRNRGGGDNPESADLEIRLLRISELAPGRYRAQIRTPSRTGWYEEGQAFESYELLDIDAEAGTVTVFSEQLQRAVPLELEDNN
jgi:hypothetical protein